MRRIPRIHLAIDNCFAYKRFTKPMEWCSVVRDLGLKCIEASADNELDPLFMGREYLADWTGEVLEAQKATGAKVVTLYSGHGTYVTLGLTHTDERVRERMVNDWFAPMIDIAAELGSGFGFFAHAFSHAALQSPESYAQQVALLTEMLTRLNVYAKEKGCGTLSVEQMYSPHQYPWTIEQAAGLMADVSRMSGKPFYFTEDVGHHCMKFLRPSDEKAASLLGNVRPGSWLGSDNADRLAAAAKPGDGEALKALIADMDANPQLFAEEKDGDCYEWIRRLGRYSPIIHLQQTDGVQSSHKPFTPELNAWGKVHGDRVLKTLWECCQAPEEPGMPEPCEDIYLTLEIFVGTTAILRDNLNELRESVKYWRRWIPEDGMPLDQLVARIDG